MARCTLGRPRHLRRVGVRDARVPDEDCGVVEPLLERGLARVTVGARARVRLRVRLRARLRVAVCAVYRVQGGRGLRDVLVPQPHGEVDGGEAEPDAHGGLRRAALLHHLEDLGGRRLLALARLRE